MGSYLVITVVVFSFLSGAIPFGHIIAQKYYGINIQEFGSGNIGSTNVNRIIGKGAATETQILDILKGLIPVILGIILLKLKVLDFSEDVILIIAAAAIVGHDFTPFLKFNGGKGVNTTLGASLMIAPIPIVISILIREPASKGEGRGLGLAHNAAKYMIRGLSGGYHDCHYFCFWTKSFQGISGLGLLQNRVAGCGLLKNIECK